ncbi:MAG: flagellar basal-body rod protein FlgF [Alphaproteobacteria bacterium]
MENPSFVALSGQMALRHQMDILANNIANMNTVGYKAERLVFTEMVENVPDQSVDDMGPMSFVQPYASYVDFSAGTLTPTGNPLDVGINGEGLFAVQTADGVAYTRNGRFGLDPNGTLVTSNGMPVLGSGGGPIQIADASAISIAGDGTISTPDGVVARLQVVRFEDPMTMDRAGNGLYTATTAQPVPVTSPQVAQGTVEESNVSPILEMSTMIEVSRAYQMLAQALDNEHQRQQKAITTLAKSA